MEKGQEPKGRGLNVHGVYMTRESSPTRPGDVMHRPTEHQDWLLPPPKRLTPFDRHDHPTGCGKVLRKLLKSVLNYYFKNKFTIEAFEPIVMRIYSGFRKPCPSKICKGFSR